MPNINNLILEIKGNNDEQIVEYLNVKFIRNKKKFNKSIYIIINSYMKKNVDNNNIYNPIFRRYFLLYSTATE